jgi:hypothetical protein
MGNGPSAPSDDDGDSHDNNSASGNRKPSREEAADPYDPFDGADTLGYRVLGVQPDSPASRAGLVSFLDFLVGADGQMLLGSGENLDDGQEYDDVDLPALLERNRDKPVEFRTFYSFACLLSFLLFSWFALAGSCAQHPLPFVALWLHSFDLEQWCTTSSRRNRGWSSWSRPTAGAGRDCWG